MIRCDLTNLQHNFINETVASQIIYYLFKNDPLGYLRRAGVQWDRRVRKSLNAMCSELKMACQGQPRIPVDREELLSKWDELSNYSIGKYHIDNDCFKIRS